MKTFRISFPRRVRIHGGECGAVARALHHAAQKEALMPYEQITNSLISDEKALLSQADSGKALGSTFIERKQMSTKTTLKRIALVAVSALGFGLLGSVSPANAAATASFSVPVTSVTVITPASSYDSSNANGAIFKIVLRNFGSTKTDQGLQLGETLTAAVVAVPAGTGATAKNLADDASDLILERVAPVDEAGLYGNPYSVDSRGDFNPLETSTTGSYEFGNGDATYFETTTGGFDNSFYLRVTPKSFNDAVNQGEYSIRLRLTSSNSSLLVQDTTIKVRFVSSPIGAGFTLTAAAAGNFAKGEAALSAYSSTKYLTATLSDANGGRVISETTAGAPTRPAILADIVDEDGVAINGAGTLTVNDDGSAADFGYSSSATASANAQLAVNGVYGITAAASWLDTATTDAAGGADKLRVRFGDKSATADLTLLNTAAGTGTVAVSATGLSVLTTSTPYDIPLTTKSVTFTASGGAAAAGNAVIFTPTWTACSTGDVSHKSATAVTVIADASGNASLTVSCNAPVDGTSVSMAVTGFSSNPAAQVVNWRASAAYSMSVSLDGAIVALKSANTFVATVTDRFGAPVAGVVLTPSVSTTGSNGSSTRTYTSLVTDANGQASYTLTDALAVAAGTDTVTFAHTTTGTAIASASATITYATTAPAPTTLTAFYSASGAATQSVSGVSSPVPTTGIYNSSADEFDVVIARNNTRQLSTSGTDMLTLRVRALEGAAVTATASSGAYILSAANTAVSSRTRYGNSLGDVYFVVGSNKTGANTITFTSGAVSTTAAFWVENSTADARFVTLTGPATATANGEPGNYKVSVTDRYGNPVSGATLSIAATGVAAFGGGATLQTFTTGASGEFTFTGTSFTSAGGAGSYKVEMTNASTDATSSAGFVGTTPVESTLAAGNSSATLAVTFAAGTSAAAAAAEAAADAAAEAIDAANAATDAANLAAEAADAATVAAEEARDAADAATAAVEELATQVATLMAALKAQITTLANTVAKIAKKVRA